MDTGIIERGGAISVNSGKKESHRKSFIRRVWTDVPGRGFFVWIGLIVCASGSPAPAQSQLPLIVQGVQTDPSRAPGPAASVAEQPPEERFTGSPSGIKAGQSGGTTTGTRMRNTRIDQSPFQQRQRSSVKFSFASQAPWRFQLTGSRAAFATPPFREILDLQKAYIGLGSVMAAPMVATDRLAVPAQAKAAKYRSKEQRAPRALGFVPNYYVAYVHTAVPLTVKRKFELALDSAVDPFTFGLAGALAGIQQARNDYSGFGQGAQGYAKRYGAFYAGHVTGTFIEGALLPSLLKQDPRYFYKGIGSKRGRLLYAIANSVICEGDNQRWQTNYSNIFGNIAAASISNFYHPAQNRVGVGKILLNALIGVGASAGLNIVQEFLTPKLTSVLPGQPMTKP